MQVGRCARPHLVRGAAAGGFPAPARAGCGSAEARRLASTQRRCRAGVCWASQKGWNVPAKASGRLAGRRLCEPKCEEARAGRGAPRVICSRRHARDGVSAAAGGRGSPSPRKTPLKSQPAHHGASSLPPCACTGPPPPPSPRGAGLSPADDEDPVVVQGQRQRPRALREAGAPLPRTASPGPSREHEVIHGNCHSVLSACWERDPGGCGLRSSKQSQAAPGDEED